MLQPSLTRRATSVPRAGRDAAGNLVGLARAQHLLERRFDLGRVRTNTQRTRQVRTGTKEQGADSGTAAIASRFFRPSTDSIMTIANRSPSGFSGHTSRDVRIRQR